MSVRNRIADVDGDAAEQTAADLPSEAMAVNVDVTDPAETAALPESLLVLKAMDEE